MSYTHFTLFERECLHFLLNVEKLSLRKIAQLLHRSPSTISREIARNSSSKGYHYWRANIVTITRRRTKVYRAISPNTPKWDYVIKGLNSYWSPETIAGKWNILYPEDSLCFSTIYRYVKRKMFPNISSKTHLRRRGKRKYSRNTNTNTIHPDRIIPEWQEEIKERLRIGDWEGDTVLGGINKGAIVTFVDRKSRYLVARIISCKTAEATKDAIVKMMCNMPKRSISLDNGSEFAMFKEIEKELQTEIYFAEPHKPWQRGTNENTNDILRFFYPKGFDFRTITQEDLDKVVDLINNRPKKILGWQTPAEVFYKNLKLVLHLT